MKSIAYRSQDPRTIQAMFAHIAQNYDLANAFLSFNIHRLWNKKLAKLIAFNLSSNPALNPGAHFLDLCAGTGAIAAELLKTNAHLKQMHLLDFCPQMLAIAKKKLKGAQTTVDINFIESDAACIPLADNSLDSVAMAYGLRNVKSPKAVMLQVARTLKANGTFAILELTCPQIPILKPLYHLYLKVLPKIGGLFFKDQEAYRYLSSSIESFMSVHKVEQELQEAGFDQIKRMPLMGGIATIILAQKGAKKRI